MESYTHTYTMNQKTDVKLCDICMKRNVIEESKATGEAIENFETQLFDGEVTEWIADEFANKQVCLVCYLEYALLKTKQIVYDEEPEEYASISQDPMGGSGII